MFRLLNLALAGLVLTGCAYLRSETKRSTDPQTSIVTETTIVRAYTLLDSKSTLTKFSNRSGYTTNRNQWSPGTYVGTLDQESTSTNLNQIIGIIVESAVKGAKTP